MEAELVVVLLISVAAYAVYWKIAALGKSGFGPYNTSTFLLLTVASLTAILAVVGMIDAHDPTSIMLAIIGFAGGLFAGSASVTSSKQKQPKSEPTSDNEKPQ